MIKEFVDRFMVKKPEIMAGFAEKHPEEYVDIVRAVITALHESETYMGISLDPERIHMIDDGAYQGTLVFVIGATGYQPSDYWYVKISYGSCSGCDTLQRIKSNSGYDSYNGKPTAEQVADYMTLALHVVQGLKKMGDE